MKQQKGFTLIELMIVITIIGLLAAFALPAYEDYVARTKATEVLTMLSSLKVDAYDHYLNYGEMPVGTSGGTDPASKLVTSWEARLADSEYIEVFSVTAGGAANTTGTAPAAGKSITVSAEMTEKVNSALDDVILKMIFEVDDDTGLKTACKYSGTVEKVSKLPSSCRTEG